MNIEVGMKSKDKAFGNQISILLVLFLLFGCGKKIEETKGDLYIDYASNFGQSAYDLLSKQNQLSLIEKKLNLIDIEKITVNDSEILIDTYIDFQYQCKKTGNASIYNLDCDEYQVTWEPDMKKTASGIKYSLLLDVAKDLPKIGMSKQGTQQWYKLTNDKNQAEYKINDAKIKTVPEGQDLLGTMWFSVELNGKEFTLYCSEEICIKMRDDLMVEGIPNDDGVTKNKITRPKSLSGQLIVVKGSAEGDGESYTTITLKNVIFKY
jgi:hypothetical protein